MASYTVTVSVASTSAKAITAFSLVGVTGTINETGKTIAVTMPYGTNVTALVATYTTTGSSVAVGVTSQISGTTANNFTTPVTYTVTAADGTTASYTVTVSVAPSPAKAITAFSLAGVTGTINETGKTIAVTMPYGTNVTALVATYTTTGSSVAVGVTSQISGTTANNFTTPVTYTVTAADGTTASYTVTVSVAPSPAKAITAFSLAGVTGTINETGKTIAVTMPYGTNVTALIATYTTTGSSVAVGATSQISSTTANNFTSPVTYTVTAADGTTASYTVTVNLTANFVIQGGWTWMPPNYAPGGATWGATYPHNYTWQEADAYCSTTTINGQTGWRLPTIQELAALVGETVTLDASGNATTTGGFNNSAVVNAGWLLPDTWSSTPSLRYPGNHWAVNLARGTVGTGNDTTFGVYVTCVR